MKTLEDLLKLVNWQYLKKLSPALLFGSLAWVHSTWYIPHLTNELQPKITKSVQDSLKKDILLELRHEGISLNLQLSKELGVPLYKVPSVLSQSVMVTDSARKMNHYIPLLDDFRRVIDSGLKYDRENKRYFLITPSGSVAEVHEDTDGIYRLTKIGKKIYLYLY